MELLLNLVWLSLSIFLIVRQVRRGRVAFRQDREINWTALIALALLVILLFPAISMTDDLMAMSAPAEVEHVSTGREAALLPSASMALIDLGAMLNVSRIDNAITALCPDRMRSRSSAALVLTTMVRAFGVRPPTHTA